jgi:hypothetical protein
MGQDFMDRFNAGGGVGAGVTPEEFAKYQNEAASLGSGTRLRTCV